MSGGVRPLSTSTATPCSPASPARCAAKEVFVQAYELKEIVTLGFLQGVVLTTLCMLLTAFFTKRRMYWKT